MRSIAACMLAAWAIGVSAAPAAAQPASDFWRHLQKLSPGTQIEVTLSERGSGSRYFLAASDSELTTLNLTDPSLPRAAKAVLLNLAQANLAFLTAPTPPGTLTDDNVRLGPAGIFVADKKVSDLADVVERVRRDQVVAVARPGGGPLVLTRPFEVGVSATGVLTWPAIGADLRATVSIPVSERHSIEIFAGPFAGDSDNFDEDIKAFYGVQVRQTLRSRPGAETFLSYGGVGLVSVYKHYTGVCSVNRVCPPPQRDTHIYPPLVGMIGGGVHYVITPRLAVRVEADGLVALVIPLGGRISVGFTVPIGAHPYAR